MRISNANLLPRMWKSGETHKYIDLKETDGHFEHTKHELKDLWDR